MFCCTPLLTRSSEPNPVFFVGDALLNHVSLMSVQSGVGARPRSLLLLLFVAAPFAATFANAQSESAPKTAADRYFEIQTRLGSMVIRLSNKTPLHRDNFRKLVSEKFYDGTTFHRVIDGFMIQGGDNFSKDDDPTNDGYGGPPYTIPAEIDSTLLHTYGAVAAARNGDDVNPKRASSGSQFYIVRGQQIPPQMLDQVQAQIARTHPGFVYPDSIRQVYMTKGGYPPLDMSYTVFGEVVEGFAVLDSIAAVQTPRKLGSRGPLMDRPLEPVVMTVRELVDYTPPTPPVQEAPAEQ